MSEFFTGIASENQDELMEELDQLEADNVEEQMASLDVPQESKIFYLKITEASTVPSVAAPAEAAKPKAEKDDDEKLLAELMN